MRRHLPALLVVLALSSPTARAEPSPDGLASFEAARAAALAGLPTAEAELRAVAADMSASRADRRDAWHLLARLLDRAGPLRAPEAIEAWRHALELGLANEAPSALPDVLRFGLARALVTSRGADAGDEPLALLSAVEDDVFSSLRADAALMRARHLEVLGRVPDAKKVYEVILERWPGAPVVPVVKARLAVVDGVPGADVAALGAASPNLEAQRLPLAEIRRLLTARDYPAADAALAPWLSEEPAASASKEAQKLWLDALELRLESDWENFRFQDALANHDKLKQKKRTGLSIDRQIKLHAYEGDFKTATKLLLRKFRGKKSKAYHAALGDLAFEHARYAEAYDAYAKAHGKKEAPENERTTWCLLRMGKADKAKKAFAKLGRTRGFNKNLYDRYWYARSLQLAGKLDDAKVVFEHLVEDAPLEYYGHQAWSRLQELAGTVPDTVKPPPPQAVASNLHVIDAPEIQPTVGWSAASLAPPWGEAPRPAPLGDIEAAMGPFVERWGEVMNEARRAAELVRLGDLGAARAELRVIDMDMRAMRFGAALGTRARSDLLDNRRTPKARGGASIREPGRKSATAVAAFKRGASAIRTELRAVQVLLADPYALRRGVVESEGYIATPELLGSPSGKRFYPLAYPEVVEPLSRQFGLPAYYVYAIMTVESAFHSGAVSVADAYGLVQVIPRTGENLAKELGYVDFTPELLLEPPVSVYFGGYYLARLLSRFRGQEPLASAAYNAGPHRVATWLMARGNIDLDMFIEDIPYDQARGYTKTVLEHIAAYRRIYHGEEHLYITNTIRRDMGDGPNY